jgi:hypothetical protein
VLNPLILTILPVDVSTEAESSPVQFIEMNMPQINEVSPSYSPSARDGPFQYLEEISEENSRGKEENR